MPLHDLHQHYRNIINTAFLDTLNGFHELPEADAVEALNFLSKQEMLDQQAQDFAPLPELFQEERFEGIREELTVLHRIMQNRQPEQSVRTLADQGREVNFGVFNLLKNQTPEQPITRELVRNYLINQFQVKIRTLKILNSAVIPMLTVWKEKQTSVYNVAMAKWVQNEAEGMPKAMQDIIQAAGILSKAIKKEYPDLTEDDIQDTIESVLILPSKLFDKDTQALEDVYMVRPMRGPDPASKLQYDALQKIQELMKNPEAKEIKDICKSFVAVDKAYRILCKHKQLLKLTTEIANIDEIETQCREYLQQIAKEPIERQKPLAPEMIARLNVFSEQADACLKNEKVEFFKDFFALYFGGTGPEKNDYLKILMDLHFSQNKICLDDAWIDKLFKEKTIIEEQKHEEEKKPEQQVTRNAILELDPFYINHLLLHACLVLPTQWTLSFAFVFNSLVDLLEHNDTDQLNAAWKQSSYPPEFIAQLKWLGYMYSAQNSGINAEENIANVAANQPDMHFPLIYYPNNVQDLITFLKTVPANNKIKMIQNLQSQLQKLVASAEDFRLLMREETLDLEQKATVFALLKNKLPQLIQNSNHLLIIFSCLNSTQIIACNSDELQAKLSHLDWRAINLIKLLERLYNPATQTPMLQILTPHLPKIFTKPNDLYILFDSLQPDSIDFICKSLEVQLPQIIQTIEDLREVFKFIHPQQIRYACENLSSLLLRYIKNTRDLNFIMEDFYDLPRKIAFCEGISTLWRQIIRTANDFLDACFFSLPPEYKPNFYRSLQSSLPNFIENTYHFCRIFRELDPKLNPELTTFLYESLKPKWSMLIKTTADFAQLSFLETTQQEEIINILLKDRLDKYISERSEKPPSKYPAFFAYTEQQKTDAANALKNGTPLTKEDIGALSEGTLGKTIKAFLEIVGPGTPLKDFLNAKTVFIINMHPN